MDMMMVVGIAIVAATLVMVIRQHLPQYALILSVAVGIVLLFWILQEGIPLFEQIKVLLENTTAQSEAVEILFKSLGICFIVQIACDTCRDMGENAIAAKVEMAGKISILVLALPLFQQILIIVSKLIG